MSNAPEDPQNVELWQLNNRIIKLQKALDESVKLQSHYARLLNQDDGGERLQFADADAWIKRLAEVQL